MVSTITTIYLTYRQASNERISGLPGWTATDRIVVYHLAFGTDAAGSWARIDAFLVHAGPVQSAFGAQNAFRSASGWTTDETGYA